MSLPWFRMYARFITDPVIEELGFEDQRHFVFLLCMKCEGLLDKEFPSEERRERAIARRLGLQGEALVYAKQRLVASGLVDDTWQPVSWDRLQFKTDHSGAERQRRVRERARDRDVTVTSRNGAASRPRSDTDTEQNPEGERAPVDKSTARSPGVEPTRTNRAQASTALQRISDRIAQGGGG